MIPRSKLQRFMVEWSNGHSTLTDKQKRYAEKHCFVDVILIGRHKCFCTHCKSVWDGDSEEHAQKVCPVCKKKLNALEHKTQTKMSAYFTDFTTVDGMQVARWFLVRRLVDRQGEMFKFTHVGTEFLMADGKRRSIELPRFVMCGQIDNWTFGSEMQLRRNNVFAQHIIADASYYTRILPILKRNGFKCDRTYEGNEMSVMQQLLINPTFESWVKVGHVGLVKTWVKKIWWGDGCPCLTDAQALAIKLANRNHIVFDTIEKWVDFTDYLRDLQTLGKDIHNPKILFPKDFQKAHREMSRKVDELRQREERRQEEVRMMQRVKRDAESAKWMADYAAKFSGMLLAIGDFTVKPLISIADFEAEADHMHHCIKTYYGKLDTLLVSVERCGEKCETAEINLLGRGDIVQCRGVCNTPSEYHDAIVKILEGFMSEFLKRYKAKADGQQTNLPVLASLYKQYQTAI